MEDTTLKELRDAVAALTEKVSSLEAKVARLEAQQAVPDLQPVASDWIVLNSGDAHVLG